MAKGLVFLTILLVTVIWSFAQDEPEPIAPFIPTSFDSGFIDVISTPIVTATSPIPTAIHPTSPFPTKTATKPPTIPNFGTMPINGGTNGNLTSAIIRAVRRMARLLP